MLVMVSHEKCQRVQAQTDAALLRAVGERDKAQEVVSQAYYLVTGRSPAWSDLFGYDEALEEIADAVSVLKQAAKAVTEPK